MTIKKAVKTTNKTAAKSKVYPRIAQSAAVRDKKEEETSTSLEVEIPQSQTKIRFEPFIALEEVPTADGRPYSPVTDLLLKRIDKLKPGQALPMVCESGMRANYHANNYRLRLRTARPELGIKVVQRKDTVYFIRPESTEE